MARHRLDTGSASDMVANWNFFLDKKWVLTTMHWLDTPARGVNVPPSAAMAALRAQASR